jgi:membrane protease YdiL (CAAX protease family)
MSNFQFSLWAGSSITVILIALFKSSHTPGPRRLDADESPRLLLVSLGFALFAWSLSVLLFGQLHSWLLKHQHLPTDTKLSDAELVVFSGLMDVAVFSAILFSANALRRDPIGRIGLTLRRLPAGLVGGAVILLLVYPLILIVNSLMETALEHLGKSPPPHEMLEILTSNPPPWLRFADIVAAGFAAPIAEELFFRGLLQTLLRYTLKHPWPAIILAAAAFSLLHAWWTWPQIFVLGLCLGFVYERTGNLWMTIAMHSLFNLTSIWVFTHPPS